MKKDVKKLLAEHRADILPDERVKEKVKRDLGLSSVKESRLSYAQGGEHALTDGKKVMIAVIAVLLVAAIFLGVFLPLWLKGGGTPVTPGGGSDPFGNITSADRFYAFGAASVGSILASASDGGAAVAAVAAGEAFIPAASDASRLASAAKEEQVATLNKYLSLVESLLSDGGISGEAIAPAGKYEFGMRVTSTDLTGGTSGYVLYYNKYFVSGETDGEESEENYSIKGVLVTKFDTSYEVTGKYQTETESEDGEHESESELSFRAFTSEDRRSYIEVRQETETESEDGVEEAETEYVYTVFEDGRRVERMTVEYETEQDETELNMTIENYVEGRSETLVFEDETEDGVRVIAVSGTLDGTPVAFRIYVRDGHYDYVFADGTVRGDRYDDDDDWFSDRFDD